VGPLERRAGLAGRVAVVVGGADGIGGAVTRALAEAGVEVAVSDIDAAALDRLSRDPATRQSLRVSSVIDARDPAAVERFFGEVDGACESLDILVNVVGGVRQRPFMESTPEHWREDARWNYEYALHTCHHAVARMRRSGRGGSIVNVTTIESHRAAPGFAVYAGYKAALTNFGRTLAIELGGEGIRVNSVAVESIPTPNVVKVRPQGAWRDPARAEELERRAFEMYVPLRRPGSADEVANCVLFLASDLASFVTGTTVHADGGAWASSGWTRWPEDGHLPRPGKRAVERLFPVE
jgi:NAD(P)-dependent dehydrogenase (short-subunit alcohol dehydrogenase family)